MLFKQINNENIISYVLRVLNYDLIIVCNSTDFL